MENPDTIAGWCAIAAAVLTVTGLVTLLAFFGAGSPLLGALNDLNTIAAALVTVPVALAFRGVEGLESARQSPARGTCRRDCMTARISLRLPRTDGRCGGRPSKVRHGGVGGS